LMEKMTEKKGETLKDLSAFYTVTCNALNISPKDVSLTNEEKEAGTIVPRRNEELKGPMGRGYLQEKLEGNSYPDLPIFREDSRMTYEILNFIDGKNSILDIRNAVSAEYEPVPVKWVKDFILLLMKADIVKM